VAARKLFRRHRATRMHEQRPIPRLFLHWPLPEALSAIRPDAMTVPAFAAAGSPLLADALEVKV